MKKTTIQLEDLACPSCVQKIEKAVTSLSGVNKDSVKILFNASKVRLEFDEDVVSIDEITESISNMGYEVKKTQVRDA